MASMNGTLPPRQRREREMLFWVSVIFMFAAAVLAVRISIDAITIGVVGLIWCVVTNIVWITCTFCGMEYTKPRMMAWLMAQCLAIISCDVHYNTVMSSCWSVLVVIADLVLLLRLDSWFSLAYMGFAVSWLLVTFLERVLRFGLFDMPLTYDQDFRRELLTETVTCSALPCPLNPDSNGSEGMVAILIFVIDFMTTRYFSEQVQKEQTAMEQTISTVQRLALHLAAYDVDSVSQILEESEETLPHEMYAALKNLEQNLRVYRPYLPKSCFPMEDDGDDEEGEVVSNPESVASSGKESACHDETTSCVSYSGTAVRQVEERKRVVTSLDSITSKKVTMLVINLRDTLSVIEKDTRTYCHLFTNVLRVALVVIEEHRGMIDLFVGDKVMCSFNASRRCLSDATAATGAAKQIVHRLNGNDQSTVNIALVKGLMACGDMGCSDMRRFSLVGRLAGELLGLERAGASMGIATVTNTKIERDAGVTHRMRLIPRLVCLMPAADRNVVTYPIKASRDEDLSDGWGSRDNEDIVFEQKSEAGSPPIRIYEVLMESGGAEADEWMYELEQTQVWGGFDQAVLRFLDGMSLEEAQEIAGKKADEFTEAVRMYGAYQPMSVHV